MRPALANSTTHPASSDEGESAARSWLGFLDRMNPSDGAPSLRRFQPQTRRTNEPLTLPVAEPRGRNLETQPRPLPPPLRSKEVACSAEAPSLDEMPAQLSLNRGSTVASNADPPPCLGLCRPGPASDALSPLATRGEARPRRFRELIAPGRTTPRAARRLLQSKRSASTTANRRNPTRKLRTSGFRPRRDAQEKVRRFLSERRSRVVTGQGLESTSAVAVISSASRRACARRELRPNPIGSDTPCRGTRDLDGRRGQLDRSSPPSGCFAYARQLTLKTRFRFVPRRAASRTLPRRKNAFRCTRGAFRRQTSPQGRAFYPHAVPSLWSAGLAPLQSPLFSSHRRMKRESEDSTTFEGRTRESDRRRQASP